MRAVAKRTAPSARVLLPVSAPFHCIAAEAGGERLRERLAQIDVRVAAHPVDPQRRRGVDTGAATRFARCACAAGGEPGALDATRFAAMSCAA